MRKLASIQRIVDIKPIENADVIEVASVLGWHVVVKKGEFKVGDLVVYCEVDSVLPDKEEFQFLANKRFRIRTVKMRGQVSQGICFPLSILPEPIEVEDTDVTELLSIVKYEPNSPAYLSGEAKGSFPEFVPKTDETRVQTLQKVLTKYAGTDCYVTEKVDGSSITIYLKDNEFGVCSRNIDLKETEGNAFWATVRSLDIENKMRSTFKTNIALQGELVGPGVQNNKLNLKNKTILFFNVFYIDEFKYSNYSDFIHFIEVLGLTTVPIINDSYKLESNIDDIVTYATRKSVLNNDVWAEGIVIRPKVELLELLLSSQKFNNGRVSFKCINPEFEIKYS